MKTFITLAAICTLAATAAAEPLSIGNIAFGTGIENHAVTGVDTTFTLDAGRIYCWTVVQNAGAADTTYHTWTLDGAFIQKVPLAVRGARYRTNSYKTLLESNTGTWTVEVTDQQGNRLAIDSVTVTTAPEPAQE